MHATLSTITTTTVSMALFRAPGVMASSTSLHQSGCASRRTIIAYAVIPYAQLLDLTRPHQHIPLSRPHPPSALAPTVCQLHAVLSDRMQGRTLGTSAQASDHRPLAQSP